MHKIDAIHPGEVLKTEFLDAFNISAYRLAKDLHVPVNRITGIVNGQRNISPETALMLSKYFGLSNAFWIRMQAYYDEAVTSERIVGLLAAISPMQRVEGVFYGG